VYDAWDSFTHSKHCPSCIDYSTYSFRCVVHQREVKHGE
jgi:hypothetical protein